MGEAIGGGGGKASQACVPCHVPVAPPTGKRLASTALQRGPASRGDLVDVLCAEFEADPAELDTEADALLVHLKRLYLIDSPAC